MNKYRTLPFRRQLEQVEYFSWRRHRCHFDPQAQSEGTFLKPLLDCRLDGLLFLGCCSAVQRGVARDKPACVVHHRHTGRNGTRARAKVDQRFAFACDVPFVHRRGTHFEFECGCHTVHRLIPIVLVVLAV
jgi:hypothetical protein